MEALKYIIHKLINFFKILIINFLILYILLFILEIFFQIKNGNFLSESKYYYREKQSNSENEIHLAYMPYKLLSSKENIIPVSGISNAHTIFCREEKNSEFHQYISDEYGFNNQDNQKNFDVLMIGDSYVHGLCLKNEFGLVSNVSKYNLSVKNLGMSANGPLLEYATFREYFKAYEFDHLVWIFNPDNDFYDFSNEIKNEILIKYLDDLNYSQELKYRNDEKDKVIKDYLNYEGRKTKEFLKHYHLDIKFIRKNISKLADSIKTKSEHDLSLNDQTEKQDEYRIKLIEEIFLNMKTSLEKRNVSFLVVINAIDPFYRFADVNHHQKEYLIIQKQTDKIKEFLKINDINYIDFEKFVRTNYSHKNIDKIFKRVNHEHREFDHYTANGNEILASMIVNFIKNNN